jgi:apolipoprotein N-acyltransferase
VAGLLFLVTLVTSTIALLLFYGRPLRKGWIAYGSTTLLLIASLVYGTLRLNQPNAGTATVFGLAAIDDAIGLQASADYRNNILQRYDQHVATLAARGAQLIVLPEKMALLPTGEATLWQKHFAELAAMLKVRLLASVSIAEGQHPVNLAWLFEADGSQVASYEKQRLAPPERRQSYRAGTAYAIRNVAGYNYGLAICKDMHFASLGRGYGQRGAAVMLVPAWDFNFMDQQLEARTTLTRGVENGYAVVRVAREGLLTVSDAYGRMLAEQQSAALPGSELLATLPVSAQLSTLYTRIGNLLGWLCVAAAVALLLIGRRRLSITS